MLRSSLALTALAVACSQTPTDVREWRATDHDNTANPNTGQAELSDGGQTGVMGIDEVALAAWRTNCVPCHGMIGRGDGPKGIPLKARDLTNPAWQASVTDEQIADAIKNGKGQMPKLELPPATVTQLVKLVRLLDPNRMRAEAANADAGAPGDAAARPSDAALASDAAKAGTTKAPADAAAKLPASDAAPKP